ncbi:hypothetical protein HIM_03578 [Hirsutella minnesotensis 3608]|uniref:PLD phosphodiesterase domain-containing protein n=1 Tax=Hirsutella minnesotensis 3608 TaxID=1043627 RepID=A0A0F8A2T3_9HYPO|nr:hypothetical protein HIM_03578 [Hirsutella minnesotensis 3608]
MSSQNPFPSSFIKPWKDLLESRRAEQAHDFPNQHVNDLDSLITTSTLESIHVGTGLSIYSRALLPAIRSARRSVHFVTCYWAASPTLDAIRNTLLQLAADRQGREQDAPVLRVTIGFSSSGLFQKLFHTSSRNGCVYPPSRWKKLGLPDSDALGRAGIELTVKSLFFTPLSVMHPKYVIIDEERAFVPSCNVSWERWFEGCVELRGDVVRSLLAFHRQVWAHGAESTAQGDHEQLRRGTQREASAPSDPESASQSLQLEGGEDVPTILLPSSHHRNPRFSFFPFLSHSSPPMTPLNAALLTLFSNAKRKITILTPNLTSGPVVEALLEALDRGVDVQIRTSKGMMLLEQLVTAGTTTARCIKKLVKRYKVLQTRAQATDLEAQPVSPGRLEIRYFKAFPSRKDRDDEPVVSHFKMTMVDDEYLVLGSGNMDRASWWTSQELGILFYVPSFQGQTLWDTVLERRTELAFHSDGDSS